MIDGHIYIAEYNLESRLPKRGPDTYASGLLDRDKGHVKFGPPSLDTPILMLSEPIRDEFRNIIYPGYYEVRLTYDKKFMMLAQAGVAIATIPVFKVDIDKEIVAKKQKQLELETKKKNFIKRKIAEKRKKAKLLSKKIEENPQVYNNATIEYIQDGNYYLIKYERDEVRAWGVLKTY
ncbi:MAG: hypothetical protein MJ229_06455 [bacterium]|nr:hypothetical protein [bacterium]